MIEDISVDFHKGFSCITGETGAGKSILLGGLSLVLGKRADLDSLRSADGKCVIEAEFDIRSYGLQPLFKELDLDFEMATVVRREIRPSGKSRAFVNDTPVTLDVLSQMGSRLIDIHSQFQTRDLADDDFQLAVLDALAGHRDLLALYASRFRKYTALSKDLESLVSQQQTAIKEHDYHSFLLKELQEMNLQVGMQETLEAQSEELSNVEDIMGKLSLCNQLLQDEQAGILPLMSELRQLITKLSAFGGRYGELGERVQSVWIEVDDIASEVMALQETVEANPQLLERTNAELERLYDLQRKHGAANVEELLSVRDTLAKQVAATVDLEERIEATRKELKSQGATLSETAEALHKGRTAAIPGLKKWLEETLASLGMPHANFSLVLDATATFGKNGKDALTLMFSANKGTAPGPLHKTASGGELSRIMLAIKALLARYQDLPTIMFDEIDTGVSGDISNRMGAIMRDMAQTMQVFAITHLPQVASKGDHHYKVYKTEEGGETITLIKKLNPEERVAELAEMLGGKDLSDSAMAHARQLLN